MKLCRPCCVPSLYFLAMMSIGNHWYDEKKRNSFLLVAQEADIENLVLLRKAMGAPIDTQQLKRSAVSHITNVKIL